MVIASSGAETDERMLRSRHILVILKLRRRLPVFSGVINADDVCPMMKARQLNDQFPVAFAPAHFRMKTDLMALAQVK